MGYSKQNGFTLVELLVVMAIIGFVSAAVAMTFGVVMKTSTMAVGQNQALSEVHMAGNWISRDVGNAKESTVDYTNKLCSMQCRVRDGSAWVTDNVTYLISNGILSRTSQRIGSLNPAQTIPIAQFIDETGTTFTSENANKYFVLTVKVNCNDTTFAKVYKMKQVLE